MKYPQLVSMPSAVSDWLEEQLEARGIDAVVYTRYVLSLLYRDPVDIICPDQDLHLTNPVKDIRRSGGGRKRFCRASDYWGHGHADADQLKRSAAVECLKSASDQKCGIESLVDELCEKLKQAKSESSTNAADVPFKKTSQRRATGQDLVKQYYAAFPPLSRHASSPNLITLIPKFGSPKKRSPRRQNRSSSYEDKLHFKVDTENMKARSTGKQRFLRKQKDLGYCRVIAKPSSSDRMENMEDYEFFSNKRTGSSVRTRLDFGEKTETEDDFLDESEESLNMYDDLPVDIHDLLESPPRPANVDMMNLANMRDTGNKKFLQCGTNIISSIWSTDAPMEDFDNTYNASLDGQSDSLLDLKFSSISINRNIWPNDMKVIKENEANSFFENYARNTDNFSGTMENQWNFCKWSEAESYDTDLFMKSLLKLNHNRDESSFTEVKPKSRGSSGVSEKIVASEQGDDGDKKKRFDTDKEDLLNSSSSHFRPINEKAETKGQYVDGTTFVIPCGLDKINTKRNKNGELFVEVEYGVYKRYHEYKKVSDELTLKFAVGQNDKACQTDCEKRATGDEEDDQEMTFAFNESDIYFPGDQELLKQEEENCTCNQTPDNSFGSEEMACPAHANPTTIARPDSMMAEIFGKFELKCDKCKLEWKTDEKQNIWSGGEVCMACLGLGRQSDERGEKDQLRKDITQDGEKLLSDLSSLQKCYMEELPVAEMSCDLNGLIETGDWKVGQVPVHSGSFSFATRLQQDCLLKMAPIPTLRSVTL